MLDENLIVGQTGHVTKHNDERKAINRVRARQDKTAIYASEYPSLQSAIDVFAGGTVEQAADNVRRCSRTLVIEPGLYNLSAPLDFWSLLDGRVIMYGARFQAIADMDAILRVNGASGCTFEGGDFFTDVSHTVKQAVVIYHNAYGAGQARRSTTKNTIKKLRIGGNYIYGLRVSHDAAYAPSGGTAQNDSCWIRDIIVDGGGSEDGTRWQYGIYLGGDGTVSSYPNAAYGNNLCHDLACFGCTHNKYNIVIDQTTAQVSSGNLAGAQVDVKVVNSNPVKIGFLRSEGARKFLVSGGPGSYVSPVHVENIAFHAENMQQNHWIEYYQAGVLRLDGCHVFNAPDGITPQIYCSNSNPLTVYARDLRIDGATIGQAFDTAQSGNNTKIVVDGWTQTDGTTVIRRAHGRVERDRANGKFYETQIVNGALQLVEVT